MTFSHNQLHDKSSSPTFSMYGVWCMLTTFVSLFFCFFLVFVLFQITCSICFCCYFLSNCCCCCFYYCFCYFLLFSCCIFSSNEAGERRCQRNQFDACLLSILLCFLSPAVLYLTTSYFHSFVNSICFFFVIFLFSFFFLLSLQPILFPKVK